MIIKLGAKQTYDWATDPTKSWPCSKIKGRKLLVELADNGDLVDIALNGSQFAGELDINEVNAIIADYKAGYFK